MIVKKAVKVLTTAALLGSLATPFAAPASAASTTIENVTSVQSFSKGTVAAGSFTKIKVTIPKGAMKAGTESFYVRLPQDFGAKAGALTVIGDANNDGDTLDTDDDATKNQVAQVTVSPVGDAFTPNGATGNFYKEFKVDVTRTSNATGSGEEGVFYIEFNDLYVPSSASGDIKFAIEAQNGTVFGNAEVVVAKTSSGSAAVSIDDVRTITDAQSEIATIRIKEDMIGALDVSGSSVKLKLPKGFYWEKTGDVNLKWGSFSTNPSLAWDDYEDASNTKPRSLKLNVPAGSTVASYLELTGLKVKVDESQAQPGDVEVAVSGDTTVSPQTLLVARYGSYKADVTAAGETPTLLAGKENQEIGNFVIKEQVPNTLIKDRTITLTLPEGAKWDYDIDKNNTDFPKIKNSESDANGLTLGSWSIVDTERRTLKVTVTSNSTGNKPGKLYFEEGSIAIEPNFKGDLKVVVGGSAGATGEIVLGKVVSPVEGTVATKKDVKIGFQKQVLDDLIITENKKGAINRPTASSEGTPGGRDGVLKIAAPAGVLFSKTPKAEILEGDASIERIWSSADQKTISIQVNAKSDKVTKIKVSDLEVSLDRTVPEGPLKLNLLGDALVDQNIWASKEVNGKSYFAYFNNSDVSSSVVVANVVTPAPTDTTASNVVFKLNSKTYTVDGKELEMDAAPLVGWDRAYLPVRFAANALNVTDSNIIWDDKTSTFTIFKGDRVITGKVGDKFLTVNGVKVPMEVPVWRNKVQTNNRVMVPIRYLANALNANIEWNKETSEITIKASK
jgi:hypothetical protein